MKLLLLLTILSSLTGCTVVGGIFKTGIGVGAIMVIVIIGLAILLLSRMGKK